MDAKVNPNYSQEPSKNNYFQWEEAEIVSVSADDSLEDVVQLMKENQIGDVVVVKEKDGTSKPVGMITDRDIALCVRENFDVAKAKAGDMVLGDIITASVHDDPFKLIEIMKEGGVSRLPLINDEGRMVSLITARNLLELMIKGIFDLTQISERQRENEATSRRH